MNDLYYLPNSRSDAQTADMIGLEAAGICIFCPENLLSDPEQRVEHQTRHWLVTRNEFPYAGTKYHWLLVPRRHVEALTDLTPDEFSNMRDAIEWLTDKYGLDFYGLGSRNGDVRFTGATIRHVHVHMIVGDVEDPAHEPVRIKLSSRPK